MKTPHPLLALVPVMVLVGLLAIVIYLFGSDSLSGGSQIALLAGSAVCVAIAMAFCKVPWKAFEESIAKTIGSEKIQVFF